MLNIVILISGRGSNMQAIVEANIPNLNIMAIISNESQAAGLIYAAQKGINTIILSHKDFASREQYDLALQQQIDQLGKVDLLVLAGFMRILSNDFVSHYQGRIINIHPSLLPAFKGLNTHARAIRAGAKVHGATVHFVTTELDSGNIIAQVEIPVLENDNAESLAARVLIQEHKLYPAAIARFARGEIKL